MDQKIILTGIKPTGKLHLGNYIGSIKPIINMLQNEKNIDVYFFIADYHALTSQPNSNDLHNNINDMILSLMSIFSVIKTDESNNIFIYRQSQIPAIFEFNWIFSCYTAKGILNRNHSYKQLTEKNIKNGKDPDKGIFIGTFNYPILMAADILSIGANIVPVGKDQMAHIIIANDIGKKINYIYNTDFFQYIIGMTNYIEFIDTSLNALKAPPSPKLLIGTDGINKMSKSYGNTVDVFCKEKELKKYIFGQKTNFKGEGDSKYPSESTICDIYRNFSSDIECDGFIKLMENGSSWFDLKSIVFEKIKKEIDPFHKMKEFYLNGINEYKPYIPPILFKNENHVRNITQERLDKFKKICGM